MERPDDAEERTRVSLPWLRFDPGSLFMTPGAAGALTQTDVVTALRRHLAGDWGEIDAHDRQENEFSLLHGLRLLGVYTSETGVQFWIITEADRSQTTVLLPSEY